MHAELGATVTDDVDLELTASPGVSVLAFPACDSDNTTQCAFQAATFAPTVPARLFAFEGVDTSCGDFTVTVTQR